MKKLTELEKLEKIHSYAKIIKEWESKKFGTFGKSMKYLDKVLKAMDNLKKLGFTSRDKNELMDNFFNKDKFNEICMNIINERG
jgi:hypothetical protein